MKTKPANDLGLQYPRVWSAIGMLMLLALIMLSMITIDQSAISIPHLDKIQHFLAWLIIMFWFASIYPRHKLIMLGTLLTVSLGVELMQALLSWRQGSAIDLLANFVGLVTGLVLAVINKGLLLKLFDRILASLLRTLKIHN